jgi:hypothetical protein
MSFNNQMPPEPWQVVPKRKRGQVGMTELKHLSETMKLPHSLIADDIIPVAPMQRELNEVEKATIRADRMLRYIGRLMEDIRKKHCQ